MSTEKRGWPEAKQSGSRITRRDFLKTGGGGLAGVALLGIASACGASQGSGGATGGTESMTKVSLQLPWFPQPPHGAYFGARMGGFYEDAGLDVNIKAGGGQTSPIQTVAAGQSDFTFTAADNMIEARSRGLPLVGVAASLQTSPVILMYHKGSGITKPEDMSGHKVYTSTEANYWAYIKQRYDINPSEIINYEGSLGPFINNKGSVSQGYVTSEPYTLEEQENVPIGYFRISDLGYNPFPTLLTTEQMVEENPETVRAFVQASMKGWGYYFDNTKEVNKALQERNDQLTLDKAAYAAKQLEGLVHTEVTKENGLGYMPKEKTQSLIDKMNEIGALEKPVKPDQAFTNEFL